MHGSRQQRDNPLGVSEGTRAGKVACVDRGSIALSHGKTQLYTEHNTQAGFIPFCTPSLATRTHAAPNDLAKLSVMLP